MARLKLIPILTGLWLISACGGGDSTSFESPHFELVSLDKGVYACIHKYGGEAICNAGIVDNGEETIIFDTFLSPRATKDLVRAVTELGCSPIRYVVNSHAHNDHIRGNQVFGKEVKIISTRRARELMAEWEPLNIMEEREYAPEQYRHYDSLYREYRGSTSDSAYQRIQLWRPYFKVLAESYKEVRPRLPDQTWDAYTSLDGPDMQVQLISLGPGHTESDLALYLPDSGILFTGDLVFNDRHPYLAQGNLEGWNSWLDSLSNLRPERVVPGHGEPADSSIINEMQSYLSTMNALARELHSQGVSPDSLFRVDIPKPYAHWWFGRFFEPNLRFAYASRVVEASE